MGLIKHLFHVANRRNSNEETATFVCPKCGKTKRVEDFVYKQKYMKEELAKETKCPTCGTQMKRKTLFGSED